MEDFCSADGGLKEEEVGASTSDRSGVESSVAVKRGVAMCGVTFTPYVA